MLAMKNTVKKLSITAAVLALGICAVWAVFFYGYSHVYYIEYAMSGDAFREHRADFKYVAEYVYDLYEEEKDEREDLSQVFISLWGAEPELTYIYEDDSERTVKLTEDKLKNALDGVVDAIPSPGGAGEFSVDVTARDGKVRFGGYEYSLYYSPYGGRPNTDGRECKLKRVELFSDKWYHCYYKKIYEE